MSDIRQRVKALLKVFSGAFIYFPFNNCFHLRGTKLQIGKGTLIAATRFDCRGKNNVIRVGKNVVMNKCRVAIYGDNNVVDIHDGAHLTCTEPWIENNNNCIIIGENSDLCGRTHLACLEGTSITIGRDCLFSSDIVFRTSDSHALTDLQGRRINEAKSIVVGDHVWIGYRVLVNKGVKIGSHNTVGTGSVVTKSVEDDHCTIAGVPAKVVKRDTDWRVSL